MKETIQRFILFVLKNGHLPHKVHYYLLFDLPFGLSPFERIELSDEITKSAIEYFKTGKQP